MRTDKQNEASRKNGTTSNGPVTPEGKAASSKNAVRHNLCAGHVVLLSNEDPREYHQHLIDFHLRFQPIDGIERELVDKMIAASWRDRRITNMETALYEIEMARQTADIEEEFSQIAPPGRQLLALLGTEDTKFAANLLRRYSATNRRTFTSAFRILKELQGDRFNKPSSMQIPHSEERPSQELDDDPNWTSPAAFAAEPDGAAAMTAPAPLSTEATQKQTPPASAARSRQFGKAFDVAAHILNIRCHRHHHTSQSHHLENTKLQNEPKRALAAGQSLYAASAQAA